MKEKLFIGVEETAELMGLTPRHIYHMVAAKAIPYYKPTRKVLFKRSEIIEYMESCRIKPVYEV